LSHRRDDAAGDDDHQREGKSDRHRLVLPHRHHDCGGVADGDGDDVDWRSRPPPRIGDEEMDEQPLDARTRRRATSWRRTS
jgi:hypothetical protein